MDKKTKKEIEEIRQFDVKEKKTSTGWLIINGGARTRDMKTYYLIDVIPSQKIILMGWLTEFFLQEFKRSYRTIYCLTDWEAVVEHEGKKRTIEIEPTI